MAAAVLLVALPVGAAVADSTPVATGDYPQAVGISPDGSRAYSTVAVPGAPGRLVAVDTATDAVIGEATVGLEPLGVAVSPDGARIYVANVNDNTISVVDAASLTTVATWPLAGAFVSQGAWGLALDPTGSTLYVSIRNGDRVEVVNTSDGSSAGTFSAPNLPAGLALDAASGYLYVARSATPFLRRIDVATGTFADLDLLGGPSPYLATLSPDGSELWVAAYSGNLVTVVDTATFTVTATVDVGGTARQVGFTAGGLVYVPLEYGAVAVVDRATRTVLGTTPTGAGSADVEALPGQQHAYVANLFGAGLSFIGPPIVATPPASVTVEVGESASFSASLRATVDSLVWQQSRDGVTWTDIPGTAVSPYEYAVGAGATQYTFIPTLADDGLLIRVHLESELFGETDSAPATLRVTAAAPAALAPSGADPGGSLLAALTLLALGLVAGTARRLHRT